jgi:hypothetical protein
VSAELGVVEYQERIECVVRTERGVKVKVKVKVHIYSPDIPESSADFTL